MKPAIVGASSTDGAVFVSATLTGLAHRAMHRSRGVRTATPQRLLRRVVAAVDWTPAVGQD